jgi:hypothetical protein
VIYQDDNQLFNKAYLMNIGFDIAKDKGDYFIFHDVDTVAIGDQNVYKPREYSGVLVGNDDGKILTNRDDHFAGATYFKKEDFLTINGFSNLFWGWGWEISATPMRLHKMGIHWERYEGVFTQLVHETSHRHRGNPNIVNNVIIYRQVDLKLMDGYCDITYSISKIEEAEHYKMYYVKLPSPQYDINKILTIEEIKNMVGECDEQDYKWIIETYSK